MSPRNWDSLRARFLRDPSSVQLGNMASDLGRISTACDDLGYEEMVLRELQEVRYFIEWTTANENQSTRVLLNSLDEQIKRWQENWSEVWRNTDERAALAQIARYWSNTVLDVSGLLKTGRP